MKTLRLWLRKLKMSSIESSTTSCKRNLTFLKVQFRVRIESSSSDQRFRRPNLTHLRIGRRSSSISFPFKRPRLKRRSAGCATT